MGSTTRAHLACQDDAGERLKCPWMLTFSAALFLSPGFKLRAKLFPLKLAIKGIFPDLPAPGCVRMPGRPAGLSSTQGISLFK